MRSANSHSLSSLRSDIVDDEPVPFSPSANNEARVTKSDGSMIFVLSDTVTGKTRVEMHHEKQEFPRVNYELDISYDSSRLKMEGSIENSVENSAFIRNLLERRQISPENYHHRVRPNNDIRIESLSENNKSSLDGSDVMGHSMSRDHIKVESNKDSEDNDSEMHFNNRLPDLDDITEHPEKETDGQSSFVKHNHEEE